MTYRQQRTSDECCHKTRLRDAPCPIGWDCPHDRKKAMCKKLLTFTPGSEGEFQYRLERCQLIDLNYIIKDMEWWINNVPDNGATYDMRRWKLELHKLDTLINGKGDVE